MERKIKNLVKSKEERQILCEEWKKSGKSKIEFCKEINIPLGTFTHWCKKLWPSAKKRAAMVPVKIVNNHLTFAENKVEDTEVRLEIRNTNVCFKLPIKNLVTFIQKLSHAVTAIR